MTLGKLLNLVCGVKSLQFCPTICDPLDGSPAGSSVHGILQARILVGWHFLLQGIFPNQWSNLSLICFLHWQVSSLPLAPPGKPCLILCHLYFLSLYRNTPVALDLWKFNCIYSANNNNNNSFSTRKSQIIINYIIWYSAKEIVTCFNVAGKTG